MTIEKLKIKIENMKKQMDLIDQKEAELIQAINTNSEIIGLLISALGIVVQEKGEAKSMAIAIPKDPNAPCGFISRLVREVEKLKSPIHRV